MSISRDYLFNKMEREHFFERGREPNEAEKKDPRDKIHLGSWVTFRHQSEPSIQVGEVVGRIWVRGENKNYPKVKLEGESREVVLDDSYNVYAVYDSQEEARRERLRQREKDRPRILAREGETKPPQPPLKIKPEADEEIQRKEAA